MHLVEGRIREELERRALFLAAAGEGVRSAPRQERLKEQGNLERKRTTNEEGEWRTAVRQSKRIVVVRGATEAGVGGG